MKKEDQDYIEDIYKKMEDYELSPHELRELINFILGQQRGQLPEFKTITKDDIEWLYVYEFLLKKIEAREKGKDHNIISQEWRDLGADFDKLKVTVDDLELYGIIKSVHWSIGGGCFFNILDGSIFKKHLYEKIIKIIQKFYKKNKFFKDDLNEKVIGITPKFSDQTILTSKKEAISSFRTNLKRIEVHLEETVKNLEGIVTQDEIENWIQQFDEDEEQILCLKLLKNIRFYDNKKIRQLCRTVHSKLLFDLNKDDNNKILFIPVGNVGKSGSYLIYLYKIENHLLDKQIIEKDEIKNQSNYDTIVFVDDLIGTGTQFIEYVKEISLVEYQSKGKNIFYLSLIGFEEGIKKIERIVNIKVKTAQKLNEKDLPLSNSCDLFIGDDKIKAKEVIQKYGEKLFKDNGLGFQNFGALISFDYRTPNITFPIFWSNVKGWFPLLKRYSNNR